MPTGSDVQGPPEGPHRLGAQADLPRLQLQDRPLGPPEEEGTHDLHPRDRHLNQPQRGVRLQTHLRSCQGKQHIFSKKNGESLFCKLGYQSAQVWVP